MKKAILVGRHDSPNKMGYDEIITRNVLFSLDEDECERQLFELVDEAKDENADLIFQNIPTVLADALIRCFFKGILAVRIFGVVSKPGPRIAGVTETYAFGDSEAAELAAEAIQFANSRAKVALDDTKTAVSVSVDPVPAFEFVRLQRLF